MREFGSFSQFDPLQATDNTRFFHSFPVKSEQRIVFNEQGICFAEQEHAANVQGMRLGIEMCSEKVPQREGEPNKIPTDWHK